MVTTAAVASKSRGSAGLAEQRVLELKEDEPKGPEQALIGKSGVDLGDSEST